MSRTGFITPSRFKDVMTVAKGYKTKEELEQELIDLKQAQAKREEKNSTSTAIYKSTAERIEELPELIASWTPALRFGDTALSYAKEIALGRFGVGKPEVNAYALEHGNTYEPEARQAYIDATGYDFPAEEFRMVSDIYPFIAGEADGQIYGREVSWGGEIKCPVNPLNHLANMTEALQWDLYKWQVTGYCSPWLYGWEGYTFISYNPYFPGEGKLWFQDFDRDQELEKELEETLVLFEMEVVRPLVKELEELFQTNVEEQWNFSQ